MEATDLIKALLEGFRTVAKSETIVGEGIKAGEYTVLERFYLTIKLNLGSAVSESEDPCD